MAAGWAAQGRTHVEESGDLGRGGFGDGYCAGTTDPQQAAKEWRFDRGRHSDAGSGPEKTIADFWSRGHGRGGGDYGAEPVGCLRVIPADRAQGALAK